MTTTTREPARTPAHEQSAGSRHPIEALILQIVARLFAAGAVGLACSVSYTRGWDPGISLAALGLLWLYVGPDGVRAAWGGAR